VSHPSYFRQVSITPEVTSRVLSRAIIKELVNLHKQSYLGGRLPAYDGRKSLYTAGPLPFPSQEFHITLLDDDDGSGSERSALHIFLIKLFSPAPQIHRLCFLNYSLSFDVGDVGNLR